MTAVKGGAELSTRPCSLGRLSRAAPPRLGHSDAERSLTVPLWRVLSRAAAHTAAGCCAAPLQVIDAGRFDQETTDEQRRKKLEEMLLVGRGRGGG